MSTTGSRFEIIYQDVIVPVQELSVAGRNIFVVSMSGQRPLVITRATDASGQHFWTCVPEHPGRHKLAADIGHHIELYLKKAV